MHGENEFIAKLVLGSMHATDVHFSFSTDYFFTSVITIPNKKTKEFFIQSLASSKPGQVVYFIDRAAKAKDIHTFNDIDIAEELSSFITKLFKGVCFVSFERIYKL